MVLAAGQGSVSSGIGEGDASSQAADNGLPGCRFRANQADRWLRDMQIGKSGAVIRVSIEVVSSGADRLSVSVRAESIRRAVSAAEGLYPGAHVRVTYPIEPETFFVRNAAASTRLIEFEMPKSVAG